jgi:hypothetical protein
MRQGTTPKAGTTAEVSSVRITQQVRDVAVGAANLGSGGREGLWCEGSQPALEESYPVRAESLFIERYGEEQYGGDLVEPRQPRFPLLCLLRTHARLNLVFKRRREREK